MDMTRVLCCSLGLVLTGSPAAVRADAWSEPSPLRREAIVEGRSFQYDNRSFLNRFSYRSLAPPLQTGDRIEGTAGSVSSTELFLDISLQKTLWFDDRQQYVQVAMQRAEDFDGYYDRQRFGYRRLLGDWHVGIAGDVRGDKAETDVHFSLGWSPSERTDIEAQLILPDAYLNQKGESGAAWDGGARSGFLSWRHQRQHWQGRLVLNSTPEVVLDDSLANLRAAAEQHRLLLELMAGQDWRTQLRLEGERSDRAYLFDPEGTADSGSFRRRMHALTVSLQARLWPLTPALGVHYLRLEEDGWLGQARAETVRVRHDEPYLFASVEQALGTRWQWQPTVYVGRSQMIRTSEENPDSNSERERSQGKLSLPFRYLADAGSGATLTLSPSFYLHEARFGGGNLQLHWPL